MRALTERARANEGREGRLRVFLRMLEAPRSMAERGRDRGKERRPPMLRGSTEQLQLEFERCGISLCLSVSLSLCLCVVC